MSAFELQTGGCGGYMPYHPDDPARCPNPVTATGLVYRSEPRPRVWQGFSCDEHASDLIAARRLEPRDQALLGERQEKDRVHAAGQGGARDREPPLALGPLAVEFVERAQAWAKRHPLEPR